MARHLGPPRLGWGGGGGRALPRFVVGKLCPRVIPNQVQWNLDLTKSLGTGQICSLNGGFVISRFFSIHFTVTLAGTYKLYRSLYRGLR